MTTDEDATSDETIPHGAYAHDSSWELPELAPVVILISVGLLVLGSGAATAVSLSNQGDFSSGIGWALVTSALRWVDPSTSTMLLIAAALIWWQYGYWRSKQPDMSDEVVDAHIARLRSIAKWNLAAFIITIVSVALLILTSILQNTYSGAVFQEWANSIQTISSALGTLLLSLLGVVGLRRILVASREFLGEDDEKLEVR
jgi:cytochrome c oxidase assembly factor CtaG